MARRKEGGRPKYRLTVKLDEEWDSDLIAALIQVSRGQRSIFVRSAMRHALKDGPKEQMDAIRRIVAEEIQKALKDRPLPERPAQSRSGDVDVEAKYGAKLDRMLGGITKRHDSEET